MEIPSVSKIHYYALAVLAAALLTVNCHPNQSPPAKPEDHLGQQIDSLFQIGAQEYGLPGAVVVLFKDGKVAESYAFGKRNELDSMEVEATFEAASLSKTMLAFLAQNMARRGELDMDEAIGNQFDLTSIKPDILPKSLYRLLGNGDPEQLTYASSLTPRSLLNHSAGFAGRNAEGDVIMQEASKGQFRYAEDGVLLLQRIIERMQNRDLEQLAHREIFEPMGLKSSSFLWQTRFAKKEVAGFGNDGAIDRYLKRPTHPLANGSLLTTATDYAHFLESLIADQRLINSFLTAPVDVAEEFPALSWGSGIGLEEVNGKTYLWQWGSNWVYRSYFAIDAEGGDGFLVFANNIRSYRFFAPLSELVLGRPLQGIRWAKWTG